MSKSNMFTTVNALSLYVCVCVCIIFIKYIYMKK